MSATALLVEPAHADDDEEHIPESMSWPLTADETRAVEWLGADFGVGLAGTRPGLGAALRLFTLRWQQLAWTILDVSFIGAFADLQEDPGGDSYSSEKGLANLATRFYVPDYLGPVGERQIWYGLGVGWLLADREARPGVAETRSTPVPSLSPSLDYMWQWGPMLNVGVGVRAAIGTRRAVPDEGWPFLLLASFHVGFTPGNVIGRELEQLEADTAAR